MEPVPTSSTPLRSFVAAGALIAAAAAAAPPPTPAVTPSAATPAPTAPPPRTLAAYACGRKLRADSVAPDEPLVISDENLRELAGDAGLTMAADATGAPAAPTPADPAVRQRWRKRYAAQRADVRRLEDRRAALEEQLRQLRRGRVDARTVAREERLRAQIEGVDEQLRRGRDAFAAVVRDARREGAQPGWFHGL